MVWIEGGTSCSFSFQDEKLWLRQLLLTQAQACAKSCDWRLSAKMFQADRSVSICSGLSHISSRASWQNLVWRRLLSFCLLEKKRLRNVRLLPRPVNRQFYLQLGHSVSSVLQCPAEGAPTCRTQRPELWEGQSLWRSLGLDSQRHMGTWQSEFLVWYEQYYWDGNTGRFGGRGYLKVNEFSLLIVETPWKQDQNKAYKTTDPWHYSSL